MKQLSPEEVKQLMDDYNANNDIRMKQNWLLKKYNISHNQLAIIVKEYTEKKNIEKEKTRQENIKKEKIRQTSLKHLRVRVQ